MSQEKNKNKNNRLMHFKTMPQAAGKNLIVVNGTSPGFSGLSSRSASFFLAVRGLLKSSSRSLALRSGLTFSLWMRLIVKKRATKNRMDARMPKMMMPTRCQHGVNHKQY